MAETMLAASSFMQELLYISKDIVWKDTQKALQYESIDENYAVQQFIHAKRGDLTFDNILFFDRNVLIHAGIAPELISACLNNPKNIPDDLRDYVASLQVKYIIENYEEKNEYYRMLNGMPPVGDTDFFYNTKYPSISDSTTPLHELPITQLYNLEIMGYLDELYQANKDKKYLLHLASKKIDPYIARIADRFSILYVNNSEFTKINIDFRDTYNSCRYALLRSMYAPERRKDNDLYDNFMAMCVLFMTLQQMLAKYLGADITRDFYDYESLKYVYDSYGVPFYASIPLEYHTKIIKNVNVLLSCKGSTQVFFKLFDIFNFGNMDVFDFYILKTHRFVDGKPVFKYNADGTEDKRAMYELKFGQVELYNNPPLELSNPLNHESYENMTIGDPYWINDKDLLDKLYETEFNYLESKYIGIRTVFDLMAMVYESCLFFKMMIDNRNTNSGIMLYFNALNQNIDLYSIIIYICALICKQYGYEGTLDGDVIYTTKIFGFNFKQDLTKIREYVMSHPELSKDTELKELLSSMSMGSIAQINGTFAKIQKLHKLFCDRRCDANTRSAFEAYTELEKAIMASNYAMEVFRKSDGTQAQSFSDLLGDICPQLYARYAAIDSEIDNEVETLLILMRQNITNLKYIELCGPSGSNALIEHLFKLLEFFKSAKASLTGYEVGYSLAKRGDSIVKFFAEVSDRHYHTYIDDFTKTLTDEVMEHGVHRDLADDIMFKVKMWLDYICHHAKDSITLLDKIVIGCNIMRNLNIDMTLEDALHLMNCKFKIQDLLTLDDDMQLLKEEVFRLDNKYLLNDIIESLNDAVINFETKNTRINMGNMVLSDQLRLVSQHIGIDDVLPITIKLTGGPIKNEPF